MGSGGKVAGGQAGDAQSPLATGLSPQRQAAVLPPNAKAGILREVDGFVISLPLGTGPGQSQQHSARCCGDQQAVVCAAMWWQEHMARGCLRHRHQHRQGPPTLNTASLPSFPVAAAGDAEIEEAVASKLYRSELQKAETHCKLNEWWVQLGAAGRRGSGGPEPEVEASCSPAFHQTGGCC